MDSPAVSKNTTHGMNESSDDTQSDLDSLNLLQAEMTKTTKELEKLRLDLFQSDAKVDDLESKHDDAPDESFVVPGLPKERTKSALERISAREQGFNVTELRVKQSTLSTFVASRGTEYFSDREISTKKDVEVRNHLDSGGEPAGSMRQGARTYTVGNDATIGRSLSATRLGEKEKEIQMLNSSKSLPSLVEGNRDVDLSLTNSWDQETATGRVLLQSLANENKLEEELVLSIEESKQLKDQLHQLRSEHERETEKNRGTVHALLKRVDDISKQKQKELDERDQENRAKEEVIGQLQKTLQDAETAMKVMEKVLDDNKRCVDTESKQTAAKHQALLQIYQAVKPVFVDRNRDMAQEDGEAEMRNNLVNKTPLLVTERVKGYVDGKEKQVVELRKQVKEAEQRLSNCQSEMEGAIQKLRTEHKEKLIHLNESHDKQLESVSERAANARKQTFGLQAQITAVEEHSQLEIKAKERQITELTVTIESLKERLKESATENQTKLANVETQLQNTQSLLEDRNAAKLQLETEMASLRKQLKENEETMKGTSNILDDLKTENQSLSKEKQDRLKELSECKNLLKEKTSEIAQLREELRDNEEKSDRRLKEEVIRLETDAKHKISEREKENEIQLAAWREKLGKVQTELVKRNSEIDLQKEATQAIVNKTKELEYQVEIISREKAELALVLDGKDKDVIVLQHERNLMENLYEKSRKESQLELREKDKLEGDLKELEPRYRELLVENQELLDKLEKKERNIAEVVERNKNVQNELDKMKKDLEKLTLSKSDVVKKLCIREKRLKHAEEDLIKEGKKVEMKNLEIEKLQKERESLEAELKKERTKLENLSKGNASTFQQVFEQHAKSEKEKRILNSQINVLQNELQLVRGALHANKAVDGKAVQFAEDMRKNAEMKRGLLESLQSKTYRLEEQLEIAQRNIDKLEVEIKNWKASCKKAEKKLDALQKENEDMASRRKEQKTLVAKLEAALEKAAFKFSESQRVIEKQEQDIARLKLQHQLELKELKGNLINQFTTTHILPKVKNTSEDVPVNSITLSKKGASVAASKDLKEKSRGEKTEEDLRIKQDVEEELRKFLGEMYQMLRGKGAMKDAEKHDNDLEEDVHVRQTQQQWNNQSVDGFKFEGESSSLESSRDHTRYRFQSLKSDQVSRDQEDKEKNLTGTASDYQSSGINVDPLSPVSTLLPQEELSTRYLPQEMKGSEVNLNKTQSQTENEKVNKTGNQAMKRLNNAIEDEMNNKILELQSKLERLAAKGDELKENNHDMEHFLEIGGT